MNKWHNLLTEKATQSLNLFTKILKELAAVVEITLKVYGQETDTAVKHSTILTLAAFLYMGLFGHGLPDKLRGPFLKGDSDE